MFAPTLVPSQAAAVVASAASWAPLPPASSGSYLAMWFHSFWRHFRPDDIAHRDDPGPVASEVIPVTNTLKRKKEELGLMFNPCLSQLYLLPIDHCHIGISQLIAANLKGFFFIHPRLQNPTEECAQLCFVQLFLLLLLGCLSCICNLIDLTQRNVVNRTPSASQEFPTHSTRIFTLMFALKT